VNTLWKVINYLIVIVIIGLTAYFLFAGPPTNMTAEQEDATIANVRQNSGYARLVAWIKAKLGRADQPPLFQPTQQNMAFVNEATPQWANQPIGQAVLPETQKTPMDMSPQPLQGAFMPPIGDPPPMQQGGFNQMERVLQSGHWIGLEANELTPALANKNGIPQEVKGVLVDKVSLLAARSGLLPKDVIVAINDTPTPNLFSFRAATRPVQALKQAQVTVYRGGSYKRLEVRWTEELGVAQLEAAQMINPTDPSPHGYYGPCDMCHAISKTPAQTVAFGMNNNQLTQAPPIKWGAKPMHENRGVCTNCHRLI
jgi:hypothetical protein